MKEINFASHKVVTKLKGEFQEFIKSHPRLYYEGQNNENVLACNHIFNSKNCTYCFDCNNLEDCKYCGWYNDSKDCQDIYAFGYGNELCYNSVQIGEKAVNVLFSLQCWDNVLELVYCKDCHTSKNLFACEGLKHRQYCVFNKQYSKDEYESLVAKIIECMKVTGEWGRFIPRKDADFAYNETMANDFYPMTKKEILRRNLKWRDETDEIPKVEKIIPADELPDNTADIPDEILNWAIKCETTKRPFKLLAQELKFYCEQDLPIPHLHPDERHKLRFSYRNPRKIYNRKCSRCQKLIQTTYSNDRSEIVYCEECYLKEVY